MLIHTKYQQPGGEHVVVRTEKDLLSAPGHRVIEYVRHNDEISHDGLWRMSRLVPRGC